MVELIQQLLLTNNYVVIPNFGAFIGNYNPSEIRLTENKIFPPNKNIAFNRSLQNNDGILINSVSHLFSISYHEAEIQVVDFVKQCNNSLAQNKSFILKDIGRLVVDNENKILFQPYYSKNYLLDSFGLPVLSLKPIKRLKDSESAIKETYQRILHPELIEDAVTPKQKSNNVAYWFTAVLAIAFLGSTLSWNLHKSNIHQNKSSIISIFDTPTIQPISSEKKVIEQSNALKEEVLKEEVTPVVIKQIKPSINKSYIVIGAFFDEVRANKLRAEAVTKGYTANVSLKDANGLFRTTVQVENEAVEATLQKVKSDINQRAWVFCVKCKLQ